MKTKETMRKIRALLTRFEKQTVDDFCRQDGQFKSIDTRIRLEKMIYGLLEKEEEA